jgi:hypothetical protein
MRTATLCERCYGGGSVKEYVSCGHRHSGSRINTRPGRATLGERAPRQRRVVSLIFQTGIVISLGRRLLVIRSILYYFDASAPTLAPAETLRHGRTA